MRTKSQPSNILSALIWTIVTGLESFLTGFRSTTTRRGSFFLGISVRIGNNLGDANHRAFVAGVIDQCEISLFHGANIFQRRSVGYAVPCRFFIAYQIVPRIRSGSVFSSQLAMGSNPRKIRPAGRGGRPARGGGVSQRLLIGLAHFSKQIDKLHLCEVEILDLDVRDDLGLQRFQLHSLGIGDGPARLFLAAEHLKLAFKFRHQPAGLGILGNGLLGLLVFFNGWVIFEKLAEFFSRRPGFAAYQRACRSLLDWPL